MPKFSRRSLENLKGIHPALAGLMQAAIRNSPVDFTVTEGVRTVERQQELYGQGRSTPGPVLTYCDGVIRRSGHQPREDGYGYAVDLYPFVGGKVQVHDTHSLIRIARHIKSVAELQGVPIEWGGDWKMRDYPHFELKISRLKFGLTKLNLPTDEKHAHYSAFAL